VSTALIRSKFISGTFSAALFAITGNAPNFALSESKGKTVAPPTSSSGAKSKGSAQNQGARSVQEKPPPKELTEEERLAQSRADAAKAKLEAQGQDQSDLYKSLYNLKPDGWVGSSLHIQALAPDPTPSSASKSDSKPALKDAAAPPGASSPSNIQPAAAPNEEPRATGKENVAKSQVTPQANAPNPAESQPTSIAPPTTHFEREGLILEFGGQEYAQRIFSRGQRRIIITVYRFASPDGAFGAYLTLRQGSSTTIRQGDATSQDDRSVSFWKDVYFVSIVGTSEDDDESLALVTGFAKTLAPNIKTSTAQPYMLTRLPLMERVQGSEKIIMGQLAAHRVFPAPYLSALLKEKIVEGAVADYKMQYPDRERVRLMLAQFSSPESASRAYNAYLLEVEAQHQPQPADGYLPQANVFKISGSFILCQLKGNEVLLITGARKKGSLTSLARQIY
jgi:hypothetical protein